MVKAPRSSTTHISQLLFSSLDKDFSHFYLNSSLLQLVVQTVSTGNLEVHLRISLTSLISQVSLSMLSLKSFLCFMMINILKYLKSHINFKYSFQGIASFTTIANLVGGFLNLMHNSFPTSSHVLGEVCQIS